MKHIVCQRYLLLSGLLMFLDYSSANNEKKIAYFFSHGVADNHRQAFRYASDLLQPHKPSIMVPHLRLFTFDYPDVTTSKLRVNRHKAALAGEYEIIHLANNFYAQVDPMGMYIAIGVSRGASCWIHFLAWYKPNSIVAAVLESPFDCADSIVRTLIQKSGLSWIPGSQRAGLALLCCVFKKYNKSGPKPIESVDQIPSSLPLFLICSPEDALVPAWSTIILYAALKSRGNPHVYLLLLPGGAHAKLIDHPQYGPLYAQAVNAFYERFALPCDPELAHQGQSLLAKCQPSLEELRRYIPSYALPWFDHWCQKR